MSTNTQLACDRAAALKWLILAIFGCCFAAEPSNAQQPSDTPETAAVDGWSSFRNGGHSELALKGKLPRSWSSKQGIGWQVELPGYGQSTPIVVGDYVLATSVDGPNKERNLVTCLSRSTGSTQWTVTQESSKTGPSNYMFSRAAPTPMADERHVFAFFESGDLMAIELESGKTAWKRNLADEVGDLSSRHGLGSSPAQSAEHLFINLEHDGPSALMGINKTDGSTAWKSERPSGSSWSSPVYFTHGTQDQVIVSSQGTAAGFAADTGEELWKIDGLDGNTVPSPTIDGSRVLLGARQSEFGSSKKAANSNLCLEFSDAASSPKISWRSERCLTHYASPVVCGEFVFLINQQGILGCLRKETGEEVYRQRLGFECWATPISDGQHLFVFGKNGESVIVKPGETYEVAAQNQLWDPAAPPAPKNYTEHFPPREGHGSGTGGHGGQGGHGNHGGHGTQGHGGHGGATTESSKKSPDGASDASPGARMLAGLLKSDLDGDGFLSGDEIPGRLASALENLDLNQDGKLDRDELKKMADSFAARRQGSRDSSRDPIVYGVAADAEGILVRTGTRLYSLTAGD